MNKLATAGPVMDRNRVFDTMAVSAAPTSFTLAAAKITAADATEKKYPGETALMEFTVSMADWANTVSVKAPWRLVLKMNNQNANNRVQAATGSAWVKYPVTYTSWTWGTTCTNTQWGIDATDTVPAVTLKVKTPACAAAATTTTSDLTITMVEDLKSTDYSTFKIKMRMDVTLPTDLIGTATSITGYILDGAGYEMVSKSGAVSTLSVTKPAGQNANQATGLVSFGKNPNDATEITNGVGVYSTPFCMGDDLLFTDLKSNCGISTAVNTNPVVSDKTKVMELTNAIEITWALPYDIPNDRTQADIICDTENKSSPSGNVQEYEYNPLVIHQASVMSSGWGVGNCFYLGSGGLGTVGKHKFQCRDLGALKTSANLALAFQFHITNIGKGYVKGDLSADTNNIVTLTSLTLNCELTIGTYSASKTSGTNWYQSKFTTQVDGNTQASKFGRW